jgi:methylenetetrahydrofolate reductase (NADPH)
VRFIRDIHDACRAEGRPAVSFEFFPPKTAEGEAALFGKTLPELLAIGPDYCSVTYGAGGTTRESTVGIVDRIQRETGLVTMMHLTCVGATREEVGAVVEEARGRGITNLLALRGDPPPGQPFLPTPGGFGYASELVAFLKGLGGFGLAVAGFPEGHIAQPGGREVDWGFLAEKINAGADFVITQLFFDNADFFRMRDHLDRAGVRLPVIPGILPVLSRGQTRRFTQMCGAGLPPAFLARLDELGDDDEAVTRFGIEYAVGQCGELLREGVPGLHFYCLNKPRSTVEVVRGLGLARG